jgi:OOP family OmpA-OmpF porin
LPNLVARGYGEAEPVADNDTADGRARNRRIAFLALPPAGAAPGGPAPDAGAVADCIARIGVILAEGTIQFAPGSTEIAPESGPRVAAIAEALRGCPDAALEVAGHTDAEGSDSGNLRLSQRRAEAVLDALRAEDLPLPGVVARGHGETQPIADNATAEGRAQNRRIAVEPIEAEEIGSDDGSE